MASTSTEQRLPGRPRDLRIDEALLRCAGEVMVERGYPATTISEIARRAGVGAPAIYRRWPNKAAIALDLFAEAMQEAPLPETGSVRKDLTEFTRLRIRQWRAPLQNQVVLPLMLEALIDTDIRDAINARVSLYRAPLYERFRTWIAEGKLRPDTDPTRMLDLLLGSIVMPLLFAHPLLRESDAEAIVDQILDGFATR